MWSSSTSFYPATTLILLTIQTAATAITTGITTPYNPQNNYTYYLEAQHHRTTPAIWPECNHRFVSHTGNIREAPDLWRGAGANQKITLRTATANGIDDAWTLTTNAGHSIDYDKGCDVVDVGAGGSKTAEGAELWRLVPSGSFAEWRFEAVHRSDCRDRFLTFDSDCSVHTLVLGDNSNRSFLLHPVSSDNPVVHTIATSNKQGCADPFVWKDPDDTIGSPYKIICTGGLLPLYSSGAIGRGESFAYEGVMLGNPKPEWAADSNRWAPENIPLGEGRNLAVFSAMQQGDGVHRLGVVLSVEGVGSRKWKKYGTGTLALGGEGIPNNGGGDIDAHFFRENEKIYILWKTDDNAIGMPYTRLWINEVSLSFQDPEFLQLIGSPVMILDSTALWWIDSWIPGGSLIEGPQLIRRGAYYYLFFATGKFCTPSYAQGVARSTSIFGPYVKLGVPLLSTGTVGVGEDGDKLVGPGHASFVQDEAGTWFVIFHASEGDNCNRRPYVETMLWTEDDWPVVVAPIRTTPSSPTISPSTNGVCIDSTLRMRVNNIPRRCNWVKSKKEKRCKLRNVAQHCPYACDSVDNSCARFACSDSTKKFIMNKSGLTKQCQFIGKDEDKVENRCKKKGVLKTCRSTCGHCNVQ